MAEPAMIEFKVSVYRPKSYRDDPAFESALEIPADLTAEERNDWTGKWLKMMEAAVAVAEAVDA